MADQVKLIFVGGAPRSGTTLVQRILNAHPEVYGGPEFDFLPRIAMLRDGMRASIEHGRIDAWLDKDALDRVFDAFIHDLLYQGEKQLKSRWVSEKTPSNVLVFPSIIDILPNARFVFVLRDPRAIVSSMIQVHNHRKLAGGQGPWFCRNVLNAVNYINQCWESGFAATEKSSRVTTVIYEELVREPEKTSRLLCESLGLPFQNEMLDIEGHEMDMAAEHTWKYWYSKDSLTGSIHNDNLEKWRSSLTTAELFIIQKRIFRNSAIEDRYFAEGEWVDPCSLRGRVVDGYLTARAVAKRLLISCGRRVIRRL